LTNVLYVRTVRLWRGRQSRADPVEEAVAVDTVEAHTQGQVQAPAGMVIDWDVPVPMSDGTVLRADVFRPSDGGPHPVLMTYGPYAKGLSFQQAYPVQWESLVTNHPEVTEGTSTRFANWETCDPERWVPFGYAVVRVDSRGAGMSPGRINHWSPRETQDYYECIEWAGEQPWSTGKVGLLGVSYYAANQWQVAALRPPHLAAICPFEGFSDYYRDCNRHGGILCTFLVRWYPLQVMNVQHGLGERGRTSAVTGRPIAGTETLSDEELAANRIDVRQELLDHPLLDDYYRVRNAALEQIEVPVLSCGNWGGQGLHLRGNVEGFLRAGSAHKWLELHGREHWTEFYTDYGVGLQKAFFDHFLKGEQNGWDERPPIKLQVRTVDGFRERDETTWPLDRTEWTTLHLDAAHHTLAAAPVGEESTASFVPADGAVDFDTAPFEVETEFTGPASVRLFVSSTTSDADLFVTLRLFGPDDREVLFLGAVEPNAPVTQGWLRASHRELDPARSTPWRPVHPHTATQPLVPGEICQLDIELWPTSIVVPAGHRLRLTVSGRDFEHGLPGPLPMIYGVEQRGSSVHLHDDPVDRPAELLASTTTLHTGGSHVAQLLLPRIP
jgi:predicted acyl esterase